MKRWFLTVDRCSQGERGVFCDTNGNSFGKESQHTEDEMWGILDAFYMVLSPQSIELDENELKEYHLFRPLAEYSNQYGYACKDVIKGD